MYGDIQSGKPQKLKGQIGSGLELLALLTKVMLEWVGRLRLVVTLILDK